MELLEEVNEEEVQKCWILHEEKSWEENIGDLTIQAIQRGDYRTALLSLSHRRYYATRIFSNLKLWKHVRLDLNDIESLRHVDCELTLLSKGSLKLKDAVENMVANQQDLLDPTKTPDSKIRRHVKDIFNNLEEWATDKTPVIVGEDYERDNKPIIYDGFHRLSATLIYYKYKQLGEFKPKEAYFGEKG